MKKSSLVAIAAALAYVGFAAMPVVAAPFNSSSGGTGVLSCANDGNAQDMKDAKTELSDQLQLSTKRAATIDFWNGCLQVSYIDAHGHNVSALYDPDTLTLVNKLS